MKVQMLNCYLTSIEETFTSTVKKKKKHVYSCILLISVQHFIFPYKKFAFISLMSRAIRAPTQNQKINVDLMYLNTWSRLSRGYGNAVIKMAVSKNLRKQSFSKLHVIMRNPLKRSLWTTIYRQVEFCEEPLIVDCKRQIALLPVNSQCLNSCLFSCILGLKRTLSMSITLLKIKFIFEFTTTKM